LQINECILASSEEKFVVYEIQEVRDLPDETVATNKLQMIVANPVSRKPGKKDNVVSILNKYN